MFAFVNFFAVPSLNAFAFFIFSHTHLLIFSEIKFTLLLTLYSEETVNLHTDFIGIFQSFSWWKYQEMLRFRKFLMLVVKLMIA